jgi:hypothetical protein
MKDTKKIGAVLYLISDILFNSVKVANAWTFKKEFEGKMAEIMEDLNYSF